MVFNEITEDEENIRKFEIFYERDSIPIDDFFYAYVFFATKTKPNIYTQYDYIPGIMQIRERTDFLFNTIADSQIQNSYGIRSIVSSNELTANSELTVDLELSNLRDLMFTYEISPTNFMHPNYCIDMEFRTLKEINKNLYGILSNL